MVYVDSVFVLNALMDYLLLASTARLSGISLRRGRCLMAAALGGAYAAAVFLPGCAALAAWPVKLLAGIGMAAAAFGGCGKFFRLTLLLFVVSCGFAGCVLALGLLSGGIPAVNGVFYTDVDLRVLLIAAGAAYVTLSVVFRAGARHGLRGLLVPAVIAFRGRQTALTALCDTGNTLLDPNTGRPMLVASGRQLSGLWPAELREFLTEQALRSPADVLGRLNRSGARFRLIPYSAVGVNGGLLLAFRSDWAKIGGKRYEDLLVALSPTELGEGFTALWGEGGEYAGLENNFAAHSDKARSAGRGDRPLYRRERFSAGDAFPGAGGSAVGADRGKRRAENADRT